MPRTNTASVYKIVQLGTLRLVEELSMSLISHSLMTQVVAVVKGCSGFQGKNVSLRIGICKMVRGCFDELER